MQLDKDFIFSANSLQDYQDCARRFELKYILDQSWPAVVSQPVQLIEEKMAVGSEFHRLARQFLEGLPADLLKKSTKFSQVREWFDRFTAFISPYRKADFFAEFSSYTHISGFRVMAVFDFIARLKDGSIIIADWKTTDKEPNRNFYQDRVQTQLYPLVAYETASALFEVAKEVSPADISLLYWFPEFPEKSLEYPFSADLYRQNKLVISNLIDDISHKATGEFSKTDDLRRCDFCRYRSLCERGVEAGEIDESQELDIDDLIASLSFDQS